MKYVDTRDLYKRQCELQEELEALESEIEELREDITEDTPADDEVWADITKAKEELADWQSEYQEELDELNALEHEVGDNWMHGETLIPESEFKNYAMDLADDLHGSEVRNASWPFDCIDWDQAADGLRMDYSSCEYQGDTYLFRG